jgi:hypothetical protein
MSVLSSVGMNANELFLRREERTNKSGAFLGGFGRTEKNRSAHEEERTLFCFVSSYPSLLLSFAKTSRAVQI